MTLLRVELHLDISNYLIDWKFSRYINKLFTFVAIFAENFQKDENPNKINRMKRAISQLSI